MEVKKRKAWNSGIKIDREKYPSFGHHKKHSDETKVKMSKNHKGRTGLKNSPEHREKIHQSQIKNPKPVKKGEEHWNWKGGVVPLSRRIRGSKEYKLWRELVYERDDWTCQKCFKRGAELNPHHIRNFSESEADRFNLDNGITFCRDCHYNFHKKYGYHNNTLEQINYFTKKQTT
jgi:hypothetical protein